MKILVVGISLLASMTSFALEQTLSERSEAISKKLTKIESKLTMQDHFAIDNFLTKIEVRLSQYSEPRTMICISNGGNGVWEKFSVHDITTNKKIGGDTSKATCQTVIENADNSLLCASNGSNGVWEKFTLQDLDKSTKLGGETSLQTCLNLIKNSSEEFACLSNGSNGVWEKFTLYDRNNNRSIGGETSLQNCLDSIASLNP